jgi:hypothetical protein
VKCDKQLEAVLALGQRAVLSEQRGRVEPLPLHAHLRHGHRHRPLGALIAICSSVPSGTRTRPFTRTAPFAMR